MKMRTRVVVVGLSILFLVAGRASAGLIVNGDFEAGNTGFVTTYMYSPGDIGPARSYDVVANPALSRPNDVNPVSYGDHTTGSGLMMAVNGALTPNTLVWAQSVAVVPGADYQFSMWLSSWFPTIPGEFDVLFNGTSIGTPSAPSTVAVWRQFTASWNSGSASSVAIEIRMTNSADIGGDFAFDDISLNGPAPVPEPAGVLMFLSGAGLLGWRFRRRKPV